MNADIIDIPKKPSGLFRGKNGIWTVNKIINGHRIYHSTGTADLAAAIRVYDQLVGEVTGEIINHAVRTEWRAALDAATAQPAAWLHRIYRGMEQRGRKKGCTMGMLGFMNLLERSNGRCEVTGITFVCGQSLNGRPHPFSPSIDRIDSSDGYHLANCRIVCYAVNMAMNAWGEEVLRKIGMAYALRKLAEEVG